MNKTEFNSLTVKQPVIVNDGVDRITLLPDELLLRIFTYCKSIQELMTLSAVCTRFYTIANDDSLWKFFYQRSFGKLEPFKAVKECYLNQQKKLLEYNFSQRIHTVDIEKFQKNVNRILACGKKLLLQIGFAPLSVYTFLEEKLTRIQELDQSCDPLVRYAFTKDHAKLIAHPLAGGINVWDLATGKREEELAEEERWLTDMDTTEDERLLLVFDKTVKVWDLTTHSCEWEFESEFEGIDCLTTIKERIFLAKDSVIQVWNRMTKTLEQERKGREQSISSLIASKDESLIIGYSDGYIQIENGITGGDQRVLHQEKTNWGAVERLILLKDGKLLSKYSIENTIALWDIKTGECKWDYSFDASFQNPVLIGNRLLFPSAAHLKIWNFDCPHKLRLKDLAAHFSATSKVNEQEKRKRIITKFLSMPEEVKNAIYEKFKRLLQNEKFAEYLKSNNQSAEDAKTLFLDERIFFIEREERAQAIYDYLNE